MAAQDEQHLYSLPYEEVPTDDYTFLRNKPQINGHTLEGNKTTSELGINIPTKLSELDNDEHFVTQEAIPTHTSQLTNNSGFVTQQDIDNSISQLHIPTKTSELTNDSNFATTSQIPTQTSQLTNNSGYTTQAYVDDKIARLAIPTKTSDLTNDSGFITSSALPTKTSDLTNDSDFTTKAYVDQEVGAIETSLQDIDGALVIKHLLSEETFTSTFDNLASNLTTKLIAIQSALHTRETAEIKGLRINTIGNVKPSHTILINSSTVIGSLVLDWQGVSYVNNVLQAIDIVNKKVLQMTMVNDRPANDAFVSYFEDATAYTFTIEYTVYKEISLS